MQRPEPRANHSDFSGLAELMVKNPGIVPTENMTERDYTQAATVCDMPSVASSRIRRVEPGSKRTPGAEAQPAGAHPAGTALQPGAGEGGLRGVGNG